MDSNRVTFEGITGDDRLSQLGIATKKSHHLNLSGIIKMVYLAIWGRYEKVQGVDEKEHQISKYSLANFVSKNQSALLDAEASKIGIPNNLKPLIDSIKNNVPKYKLKNAILNLNTEATQELFQLLEKESKDLEPFQYSFAANNCPENDAKRHIEKFTQMARDCGFDVSGDTFKSCIIGSGNIVELNIKQCWEFLNTSTFDPDKVQKVLNYPPQIRRYFADAIVTKASESDTDKTKLYETALKICPKSCQTWATIQVELGKIDDACTCYMEMIELEPKKIDIYLKFSELLQENKKYGDAKKWLEKGIKTNSEEGELYVKLGKLLKLEGTGVFNDKKGGELIKKGNELNFLNNYYFFNPTKEEANDCLVAFKELASEFGFKITDAEKTFNDYIERKTFNDYIESYEDCLNGSDIFDLNGSDLFDILKTCSIDLTKCVPTKKYSPELKKLFFKNAITSIEKDVKKLVKSKLDMTVLGEEDQKKIDDFIKLLQVGIKLYPDYEAINTFITIYTDQQNNNEYFKD